MNIEKFPMTQEVYAWLAKRRKQIYEDLLNQYNIQTFEVTDRVDWVYIGDGVDDLLIDDVKVATFYPIQMNDGNAEFRHVEHELTEEQKAILKPKNRNMNDFARIVAVKALGDAFDQLTKDRTNVLDGEIILSFRTDGGTLICEAMYEPK